MKESLPLSTKQGNDPHPEHCSRPAYSDGSGHTRQIARTYTAGNRDGKCLE